MKLLRLLICITAVIASTIATDIPLKEGIYFAGNGKIWRIYTDGRYEQVSSGDWTGTTAMGVYNRNKLFAIWKNNLYEVFEKSWVLYGSGYNTGSSLAQNGNYLYTTIGTEHCARCFRIEVDTTTKKATLQLWGSLGIYPQGLAPVHGGTNYLIGAGERWTLITLAGDGISLTPGAATAITSSPLGGIYAITPEGDIVMINAATGATSRVLTSGGLFKGTHGIAWYREYLYAIGSNHKFYEIRTDTGEATIKGTANWEVGGRMAAIL